MDISENPSETFLKADEVDETIPVFENLSMSDGSPPKSTVLSEQDHLVTIEDGGPLRRAPKAAPMRPSLQRNKSVPDSQADDTPAPTDTIQELDVSQDSLSLGQLKKLVADMPRVEPTPYAFEYEDMTTFEEDIEELFGYTIEERASLLKSQRSFIQEWQQFNRSISSDGPPALEEGEIDWSHTSFEHQTDFIGRLSDRITNVNGKELAVSLECLLYILLGCWHETAGQEVATESFSEDEERSKFHQARLKEHNRLYQKAGVQVRQIKQNMQVFCETMSLEHIFAIPQQILKPDTSERSEQRAGGGSQSHSSSIGEDQRRSLWACFTIMYLIIDLARREPFSFRGKHLKEHILEIKPSLLHDLTDILASLRWDDRTNFPLSKLLLLYWKAILLSFGGTREVEQIKSKLGSYHFTPSDTHSEPQITASPLDYHLFRQEITSKYPAFDPPPALFPFEPDSNSMLPPLQDWNTKPFQNTSGAGPANIYGQGASIIHQPVHIATPAPSPPPSPAGPGGKGIKKQNYQTNQMFPFLYPPLEESSNDLGGKGSTELQDLLVGRKWAGSDIPTSILEAADLFASRMRATRAMKQLWKERVQFMKYERGYDSFDAGQTALNDYAEENARHDKSEGDDLDELKSLDDESRQKLDRVEKFYQFALPRFQSIAIVLLKVLLQTVTTLVTQSSMPNGLQNGFASPDNNAQASTGDESDEKNFDPSLQELDSLRSQEIMGKAVSAILLLILKWLKVSHILKFEYLTQLLLDSNYIQLILKLFTHQELERVVKYKCEHRKLNFFNFCEAHSRNSDSLACAGSEPESDAVPPSIKRTREPVGDNEDEMTGLTNTPPPPEVDELGYPVSEVPDTPITNFSWRAFFSSINYLRILQKIVKSKPHRQILMAQYKYSNVLKKALKVPQPDIRLYTLKVIKGQIPYCHRKWRQGNMRVITAIYLHCRPNLRDEWLIGLDAEQEMGEALPAEQALRSLTYWYNLRKYPDQIGPPGGKEKGAKGQKLDGKGLLEEDQDFFLQELEKMEVAMDSRGGSDGQIMYEEEEFLQQPGGGLVSDIGIVAPLGGLVGPDTAATDKADNPGRGPLREHGTAPPHVAAWT